MPSAWGQILNKNLHARAFSSCKIHFGLSNPHPCQQNIMSTQPIRLCDDSEMGIFTFTNTKDEVIDLEDDDMIVIDGQDDMYVLHHT